MDPPAGRRVLVVSMRVPTPDFDTASARLEHLLDALVLAGNEVTYLSTRPGSLPELAHRVAADTERLRAKGIELPAAEVPDHLAVHGPRYDVVIASYLEAAYLIADLLDTHAPQARRIFDTVDVHHLRLFRTAKVTGNHAMMGRALRAKAQEVATVARYHHTLAVSDDEQRLLASLCPRASLSVLGCAYDPIPAAAVPPPDARSGTVFVANYLHLPNEDAMVHYVGDLLGPVRALVGGRADLRIVGGGDNPAVEALAGDGVEVVGWVPSVAPELDRARIFVAPLRHGSGIKGKVIEALARGVPVVTTPVGAEGIGLRHGHDALIAEPGPHFVQAVADLATDDDLWHRLSQAGLARAHAFSFAVFRSQLDGAIRAALGSRDG